MKLKIISGGQTGADIAGLRVGKILCHETGGAAPRGFLTLDGQKPELAKFGLTESMGGYRERTIANVRAANMTLIFSKNLKSPGTVLTINTARKLKKPFFVIQDTREPGETLVNFWSQKRSILSQLDEARVYMDKHQLILESEEFVLNVAGNATRNAKESFEFAFIGLWILLAELNFLQTTWINEYWLESVYKLALDYKDRYDDN